MVEKKNFQFRTKGGYPCVPAEILTWKTPPKSIAEVAMPFWMNPQALRLRTDSHAPNVAFCTALSLLSIELPPMKA
jgi:hypothetical protein